jgi:type IV secretion system protein VirB8
MFEKPDKNLDHYFKRAEHWALDRERAERSSRRVAWIAIAVLATVAVAEAVAIVVMLPLKTVVPYTLMVDRQTGYIQALKPLDRDVVAPDRALTRSFISQYVIAREGFDQGSFREDYRKVSLWSTGEARDRYVASMQPTNPASPLGRHRRRDSRHLLALQRYRAGALRNLSQRRLWPGAAADVAGGADLQVLQRGDERRRPADQSARLPGDPLPP